MKNIRTVVISIFVTIFSAFSTNAFADEGLWTTAQIEEIYYELQKLGIEVESDFLFSENKNALHNAIFLFGNSGTAVAVSDSGLILTSYDCALPYIQQNSTLTLNMLNRGFYAKYKEEEMKISGLKASRLVLMQNVTDVLITEEVETLSEELREQVIREKAQQLIINATKGTSYDATVKALFFGLEYWLVVTEDFYDVRLVFAPPMQTAMFGGITDAWQWPRHNANFAFFRIYANAENKATYIADENKPYVPKFSVQLSSKGVKENDFVMAYGYPAVTSRFLTSFAINFISDQQYPAITKIREKKIEVLRNAMNGQPFVTLKYAAKYYGIKRYFLKWSEENEILKQPDLLQTFLKRQQDFTTWANRNTARRSNYGTLIDEYEALYKKYSDIILVYTYLREAVFGVELLRLAEQVQILLDISNINLAADQRQIIMDKAAKQLRIETDPFFDSFHRDVEREMFEEMMRVYGENITAPYRPEILDEFMKEKYQSSPLLFANEVFNESFLESKATFNRLMWEYTSASKTEILNDKLYQIFLQFHTMRETQIMPQYNDFMYKFSQLSRKYIQGIKEMYSDSIFYPDANNTLRLSVGKVKRYSPRDGVTYHAFTTPYGFFEKQKLVPIDSTDYLLPTRFNRFLSEEKDSASKNWENVSVCFLTNIHISDGSSGSPVFNKNGNLVGICLERNEDAVASDFLYQSTNYRSIAVDIRFVLYYLQKFEKAEKLLGELKIAD